MKLSIVLFLSIVMCKDSSGITFISQGDGCWNDKSVWQNGNIPGYTISDTVIINSYVSFLQDLTLSNNSILQINPPGSICGYFDIHVLDNSQFIIYGSFYADTILVPSGHVEINNSGQPAYFYIMTISSTGTIHIQGPWIVSAPPFSCNCGEVGFDELNNNYSDKISVFPVPSTGDIFIRTELDIKRIEVFNSLGQVEIIYPGADRILLPNKPGIYFLRMHLNNGSWLTKEVLRM